jgi:hypothetical protein
MLSFLGISGDNWEEYGKTRWQAYLDGEIEKKQYAIKELETNNKRSLEARRDARTKRLALWNVSDLHALVILYAFFGIHSSDQWLDIADLG